MKPEDKIAHEKVESGKTHVGANGGSQSHLKVAFHLIPYCVMADMARVYWEGTQKYGDSNWKLIPDYEHIDHAIHHLYSYLSSENGEELAHALVRVSFALYQSRTREAFIPEAQVGSESIGERLMRECVPLSLEELVERTERRPTYIERRAQDPVSTMEPGVVDL